MAQISKGTKTISQGGNSYSTPTRIQHRPQPSMRGMAAEQPETARVPPFLRILGQPPASTGDLSQVILRQGERPENLRY
ncbi:hypothetical protein KAM385_21040 [Aeromonas hydrophila]|nr:hypothetical protein KAM385_21040 [Aeromonas hydrophila]GKQ99671.1 hypothetical protein KAM461_39210 [Aeromonas hydrophila]